MRVLVRGAGVAGLTLALELHRKGVEVTVMDTRAGVAGSTSWLAGGMLAPWCERESAEEPVLVLGRDAAAWWEAATPGLVRFNGTLVLAPPRDEGEISRFSSRTTGHRSLGAAEIAACEPDLADRFTRGLFFDAEAHLDPRAALAALHARLAADGVRFVFSAPPEPPAGWNRQHAVIADCRGMASGLEGLRGVRGEMLIVHSREVSLSRPVRLLHPRIPVYVVPRADGNFMIGATMIEREDDGPVTARSAMELLGAAYALHPAFGEAAIMEMAAGVRPAFADNLPRVIRDGRTLHVNGLYRHGFLLAPAMAQQAAAMILETTGQTGPLACLN